MAGVETEVRVKRRHIREGLASSCHRCAVALGVGEATGDRECLVVEKEWTLYLVVWGRYLVAPRAVRQFVHAVDGLEREPDGRPKLPRKLAGELAPFRFTLPPGGDPGWEEACDRCEALFDPADLDHEGYCDDCRKGEDE